MANNLSKNTSTIVLKKFLSGFMSDIVLAKAVDTRIIAGEINENTGSTVQVKRPHQYIAERSADGDVTGTTKNKLTSATATATVGDFITVRIEYTALEEAIELNQLDEILKPIRQEMVVALETEIADRMVKGGALNLGLPDTAITKWGDVAQASSFLHDLGVPGDNMAALDPWATQDLADAQGQLSNGDNSLVNNAWNMAQISRNFGGVVAFNSNGLANYTAGNEAGNTLAVLNTPVVTYSALKDTYQLTFELDGLTNTTGTLKAGDILQFNSINFLNQRSKQVLSRDGAPIKFTGTVTADVTANGSGEVTVTIAGAPIFDPANEQYNVVNAALADNDVVTVLGTADKVYKPSLFFNKEAFAIATVPLKPLNALDSTTITFEGFSIRATAYSDGDKNAQRMRFDLLPAFAVLQPHKMGKLNGNV